MYRPALTVFVIFAALVIAQGTSFKRIDLHNGLARLPISERSLADSTLYKYSLNVTSSNTTYPTLLIDLGSAVTADNSPYASVAIYLHTSVSGLAKSTCGRFNSIACDSTTTTICTIKDATTNYWSSPNMKASGSLITPATFTIKTSDSSAPWKLTNSALYATSCTYGSNFLPTLTNTYGWIGLGIDAGANTNFQTTSPIFSVSIDKTGTGSIYFGINTTTTSAAKGSVITLPPASNNWDFQVDNITFGNLQLLSQASNNLRIIFDINTQGIMFPTGSTYYFKDVTKTSDTGNTLYTAIVTAFNFKYSSTAGLSSSNYLYKSDVAALPVINFTLTSGVNISIPGYALFQEMADLAGNYSLIANVDSQTSSYSGQTNVNYIILGRSFMSQFYTVFQNTTNNGPQISLYPLSSFATTTTSSSSSSSSSKTLYIIIAAVVLVLVIGLIVLKGKSASKVSSLSNFAKKPSTGFELR